MLHLCNFLKMNLGNGKQQIVRVGFVRHTLTHRFYLNMHRMKTVFEIQLKKITRLTILLELKTSILQLIPPNHV